MLRQRQQIWDEFDRRGATTPTTPKPAPPTRAQAPPAPLPPSASYEGGAARLAESQVAASEASRASELARTANRAAPFTRSSDPITSGNARDAITASRDMSTINQITAGGRPSWRNYDPKRAHLLPPSAYDWSGALPAQRDPVREGVDQERAAKAAALAMRGMTIEDEQRALMLDAQRKSDNATSPYTPEQKAQNAAYTAAAIRRRDESLEAARANEQARREAISGSRLENGLAEQEAMSRAKQARIMGISSAPEMTREVVQDRRGTSIRETRGAGNARDAFMTNPSRAREFVPPSQSQREVAPLVPASAESPRLPKDPQVAFPWTLDENGEADIPQDLLRNDQVYSFKNPVFPTRPPEYRMWSSRIGDFLPVQFNRSKNKFELLQPTE